ncbi:glycoside hydrolase [Streptomyces cadmiisoli]|uniref:glycoside hydrolase n=1 Tax=Streptomyces cadmiisoli TaxID=2184053 RepID=UPI003D741362
MINRRTLLAAAGAGAIGSALATGTARADSTITVDPSKTYGTWDGWGTSLAWWAKVFGNSAEYADVFADLLFTDKTVSYMGSAVPGLNLNIARYNLGACSWNTVARGSGTVRMDPGRIPWHKQIAGFWLDPGNGTPASEVWNWDADPAQRAMLLKATQRGAKSELFSNSPMWWMTNSLNPSGATQQYGDNLNDTYRRHHASHLARVAVHARDNWGVDFVSVEPFNEPKAGNWWTGYAHPQEGCCINTAEQKAVLALLREELDNRGLSATEIAASDDATFAQAIATWNDLKNNGGHAFVDRVNVHGYGANHENADAQRAQIYNSVVSGSGKALWSSENGTADADGFRMAEFLLADLYALHPTAWAYWQPLDTHPDWAMIHFTVNDGQDPTQGVQLAQTVNTKFSVMGQFSRHIRPGMKMLHTGVKHAAAALDETANKLVIVVANNGPRTNMTFDLTRFSTATGGQAGVVHRWNTGVGERYVRRQVTVSGKKVTIPINTNCVQTLEIEGVAI